MFFACLRVDELGVLDEMTKCTFRDTFDGVFVVETKVSGVNDCFGVMLSGKLIQTRDLACGIAKIEMSEGMRRKGDCREVWLSYLLASNVGYT